MNSDEGRDAYAALRESLDGRAMTNRAVGALIGWTDTSPQVAKRCLYETATVSGVSVVELATSIVGSTRTWHDSN